MKVKKVKQGCGECGTEDKDKELEAMILDASKIFDGIYYKAENDKLEVIASFVKSNLNLRSTMALIITTRFQALIRSGNVPLPIATQLCLR